MARNFKLNGKKFVVSKSEHKKATQLWEMKLASSPFLNTSFNDWYMNAATPEAAQRRMAIGAELGLTYV